MSNQYIEEAWQAFDEGFYEQEKLYYIEKLNEVCVLSYKDRSQAWAKYNDLRVPFDLLYLHDSIASHLFWADGCHKTNEFDLHDKFVKELPNLILGAKIIKNDFIKGHRPDFFITINDELYVVEIKPKVFDQSAVRQLQRYMKHYIAKGIAVAPTLKGNLSINMTFIPLAL